MGEPPMPQPIGHRIPMTLNPSTSMRRDVISAYVLTACRVGSWAVVSAVVFRRLGADAFAMLALVRATLGALSYTTLGLAPAMVRMLAMAGARQTQVAWERPVASSGSTVLDYAPAAEYQDPVNKIYSNGVVMSYICGGIGLVIALAYCRFFDRLHVLPVSVRDYPVSLACFMGLGMIARLISDVPGALLQVRSRIWIDNLILAGGEVAWAALVALVVSGTFLDLLWKVGANFALVSTGVLLVRKWLAESQIGFSKPSMRLADFGTMWRLIRYGGVVVVGQMADFLYAPVACILINRMISPAAVADYSPALQIDAGLMLLVGGLAAVLLPKAALAHAAGDRQLVRRYYLHGTLAGAAMLAAGAAGVWFLSPWIFRLWLNNPMLTAQTILPLVLIHTVIGGSSAVGRSILLGMGKVKAFTATALAAGVANVILSFIFVKYLHLGLRGIVLGTIVVVVARCGVWMPWYVMKVLRQGEAGVTLGPDGLVVGAAACHPEVLRRI
jgi:O-antigen/teichoic acid export membrane protein